MPEVSQKKTPGPAGQPTPVRESVHTIPPEKLRGVVYTMSVASGLAVANIYYNQPMLAEMGRSLHASAHEMGLVATFTQIGYAAGMPLFVPLGDLVARKKLILCLFFAAACALAGAAMAPNLSWLVVASFLIGVTTIIAQILIPLGTELAAPSEQGRTIGAILSGVLLGILLARTVSGIVADHFGWRTMFWLAAALALLSAAGLAKKLPEIPARQGIRYTELIRSIWTIFWELPKLRQVCLIAAMFFAAFSAFWTTLVFRLETPPYHYGSQMAGLFGLFGASGAFVAPISGRLSDRHGPRYVVRIAIGLVAAAFLIFAVLGTHLWALIAGVILLDAGIQGAQVANQSSVLSLRPEARNRINTVYMICYFGGGSMGSLLASWTWSQWQWTGVCATGLVLMAVAVFSLVMRGAERD